MQFGLIVIYKLRTRFFPLHKAVCRGPSWWIARGNCFQMRSAGLEFGAGILPDSPTQNLCLSTSSHEALPTPQSGIFLFSSKIAIPSAEWGGKTHQEIPAWSNPCFQHKARPGSHWGISTKPLCPSPIILGRRNNSLCVWERISVTRSNRVGLNHNNLMQGYKLPYQLLLWSLSSW